MILFQNFNGSGTLLVTLYKDAGTPAIECSLTKFSDSIRDHSLCDSKVLSLSLTCYKCNLNIGSMTIESVPHPLTFLPHW